MTVHSKISKQDYNNIQSLIASVLGSGQSTFGYGQPVISSQVTESNKVSATDWANLRIDILNCYLHTTGNTPANPQAAVNAVIRSNPTDSPFTRYQVLADVFSDITNRIVQPPADRQAIDTYPISSTTWPGPFGDYWRTQTESIVRLAWDSSDQARHFFNSGGRIRLQSRRTGGETSTQNAEWTNLLNSAGVQEFGADFPQTGTGETQTLNGGNFYRLDNQFRTFYTVSKTGTYSANSYSLQARAVNASGNNNGTGTASIIEIRAVWSDNFNSTTPGSPDRVNGNMEVLVSNTRATGSLLPSGTFTIQPPVVTITPPRPVGAITGSTYSVEPRQAFINEGSSLTFDITTTNVPNNTTLFWSIFGGPRVTSADFSQMSGSFIVNNNSGTVTVSAIEDRLTEGTEFFYLEIRSGSTSGPIVATSRSVNINDTSFVFFVDYAVNTSSTTVLRNVAIARGWDQIQRLEFHIRSTSRLIGSPTGIGSYNKTDSPTKHRNVAGLVVSGNYPNGLIIRNDGSIIGRGGTGGLGGLGRNSSGSAGIPGGPGLVFTGSVTAPFITLINNGAIRGAGGGGGGGAGYNVNDRGGGGGGGVPLGAGGVQLGGNATALIRGAGGNPDDGYSQGGAGGNLSQTGLPGRAARPGGSGNGGPGGANGFAIIGSSVITSSIGSGIIVGGSSASTAAD